MLRVTASSLQRRGSGEEHGGDRGDERERGGDGMVLGEAGAAAVSPLPFESSLAPDFLALFANNWCDVGERE
jgi:hypothetical protein